LDLFYIFSWRVSLYLLAICHHDSYSFNSPIHAFHANSSGEYISSAHCHYLVDLGTLAHLHSCFRANSSGEYIPSAHCRCLADLDTVAHFSCPGANAQNRIDEPKHCHILETACALLISTNLAPHFWAKAVPTVFFLINQ
jgi:hypothetical protein